MMRPNPPSGLVPVLLAGFLAACGGHRPETGVVEPAPVRATLATAERVEAPQVVELHGVLEAERRAAVSSRVMAMVTRVAVQSGDRVERGALLLEIDPQAARGQLAQAQGGLGQARAALALAERNYERFRALAETEAASDLELDMARMQYEQAQAAVEQAEGAVAAASAVASDSRVTAPFAGRVAERLVEVGDLAAPGRPLVVVESEGARRLALTVPESLAAASALALGTEVEVEIDSRPDLGRLAATVVEMAPGADPVSHSYRIEVAVPAGGLASGAAGRAWLISGRRSVVAVPAGALLRQGGLEILVARSDDGRTSPRVVTVGERLADGRVEILSGLAGGETVLVGLGAVPPAGAPVEPAAEDRP